MADRLEGPLGKRIAVIDVGTRAARLLIADDDSLDGGFEFYRFRNEGARTAMGEGRIEDGITFEEGIHGGADGQGTGVVRTARRISRLADDAVMRTVEALRGFGDRCRQERVDKVIAVGTAALRDAANQGDVIETIEAETGIRVRPIEQRLEGELSILAALVSMHGTVVPYGAAILMIDQGGGSAEVSVGGLDENNKLNHYGSVSLDLGTDRLLEDFRAYPDEDLRKRHVKLMAMIRDVVADTPGFDDAPAPKVAVGIGSAITTATHKKRNRQQHGTRITTEEMQRLVDRHLDLRESDDDLDRYSDRVASDLPESMRESLLILCGLPSYQLLLERYEHECLWVCGAGLRYGVFISEVQSRHEWPDCWTGR